jgi:RNA polymerase sigma-70 factor (ECF subfamily)
MECLSLLGTAGSEGSGARALEAVAELAAVMGLPERAAEYYGARERIAGESQMGEEPHASEERTRALNHLRAQVSQERFKAAWGASQDTSCTFEFYVSTALHWLESLEGRLPVRMEPAPHPSTAVPASEAEAPGSTAQLIIRSQDGSTTAKDRLSGRFVGPLRRFAHGRLPNHARDLMDTDDLVVVTLARGLEKVDKIDAKRKGGFFAYLRQILVNQVRDEIRRHSKRPKISPITKEIASVSPSPLEQMIERETFDAYQSAVSRLPARQQEALTLRIDRGCSYQEVADAIGCPSANAARMVVSRALELVATSLVCR